jgi:hypothetical protein
MPSGIPSAARRRAILSDERRWPCHYLYDDGLITLSMQVGPISLFGELPRARKECQRRLAASFRLTS